MAYNNPYFQAMVSQNEPSKPYTDTTKSLYDEISASRSGLDKMTNQTSDLITTLRTQAKKYQTDYDNFDKKYGSLIEELLAKKQASTGNIFKDFAKSANTGYNWVKGYDSNKNFMDNLFSPTGGK